MPAPQQAPLREHTERIKLLDELRDATVNARATINEYWPDNTPAAKLRDLMFD